MVIVTMSASLAACAAREPAGSPAPVSDTAEGWVRHIAPVEVLNGQGEPYDFPFLGGFNVPRPDFVDIDADGDLDLFVQERLGELMFFENTGSRGQPEYVWRTDQYQGLDIGAWYRFVDLNQDGVADLFAEQPYSYIRYYRNVGSPESARFELAADSLRDAEGEPVFSDRQNIPYVIDIDCNNLPDLFLGRLDGTITRFEMVERGGEGAPRFGFLTDDFQGIRIIGQTFQNLPNIPSARHGANSMAFADIDGDGDPDFLWGDFFEAGVLFIENRGTCPAPSLRAEPVQVPGADEDALSTSGYNVPVPVDVQGDGGFDLFLGVLGGAFNPHTTAAENFYFFERLANGELELRTRRYLDGIDIGSESNPAFADADGDGDLDLFVGNKIDPVALDAGRLYYFENVGTGTTPRFALTDTLALRGTYHQAPAFGDLDGDGEPDLLLGSWNEGIAFYRGGGDGEGPRFTLVDSAFVALDRGSHSTPALGDLDGDGDLDLIVGEASGTLNFYRNEGSAQSPRFVLADDEYLGIDVGRRSVPALVDIDGDGDLDLAVGSEAGDVTFYRNEGTARAPEFAPDPASTLPLYPYSAPSFADLDDDGRLEVISGAESGGLTWWEAVDD